MANFPERVKLYHGKMQQLLDSFDPASSDPAETMTTASLIILEALAAEGHVDLVSAYCQLASKTSPT
jgi:hypothetical protein